PKSVDTLRIITDNTDILLLLGQETDEIELKRVRILILIHKYVLVAIVVFLTGLGRMPEQFDGFEQKVIKIESIRNTKPFIIHPKDLCDGELLFVTMLDLRGKILRRFSAVLCRADRPADIADGQCLFINAEIFDARLYDLRRIISVVDRKRFCVALFELVNVLTQDADAEAVKGRDQRDRKSDV